MYVAKKLLEGMNKDSILDALNSQDNNNVTCFGMLFAGLADNTSHSNPLTQEVILLIGADIRKLNPFVRFDKKSFPYTQLGYSLEDKEMIHPLILLNDVLNGDIRSYCEFFDLLGVRSYDKGNSFFCQCFQLGKVGILDQPQFVQFLNDYLKEPENLEYIESILSKANKFGAYQYYERVQKFLLESFKIAINVHIEPDDSHSTMVKEMIKRNYDYESDSEMYLDREIPRIMAQNDDNVCPKDSIDTNEKHCVVVRDPDEPNYFFDCMMKKVDIKRYYYGEDSFYVMQLMFDEVKKVYILWTRWGRSGSIGQFQRTPFGRLEDGKKEFLKIFKQKTAWAWKDIADYTKKEKKYDLKRIGGKLVSKNHLELKFSNADFQFEKLMISIDSLNQDVKMENPGEFKRFLKPLVNDINIYNSLRNANFSNALMLLAPQDKSTIDEGIKILRKIKAKLEESQKFRMKNDFEGYSTCMDEATALNSEYLEVIPKVNPTLISAFLYDYQVDQEIQMLEKVFSLSYSVRAVLGAYLHQDTINPFDYILGTLNVTLNVVDPNSEDVNLILHYLNSDAMSGYNLRNVLQVDDLEYSGEQNEKFYSTKNHMMLWHGTSATNILSIIKNGLKIAPVEASHHHGARYGKGIYFSDSFALSSCYSVESDHEKYILLCEVALGNMANILSFYNTDLEENGWYDSIRAMSSTGPDWDGFVKKNDVIYPIGHRINYPNPDFTIHISDAVRSFDNRPTALQKHFEDKIRKQKMLEENPSPNAALGISNTQGEEEDMSDDDQDDGYNYGYASKTVAYSRVGEKKSKKSVS